MEKVKQPYLEVTFNGKNVTADLLPYILSATYTDRVAGESDDLSITMEDVDGLWKNEWYPAKGDKVTLKFGYDGGEVMDSGEFELDEIEFSGPPDTVTIKALAAGIKKPLRTKNSKTYENQTLKQIAQQIASRNGLTLQGEVAEVQFTIKTQHREEDLRFLKRISYEYGYTFSIRGTKLIFIKEKDLQKEDSVVYLDRTDLSRYSLKDKTSNTYANAKVKYHNPADKTVKSADLDKTEDADGQTVEDGTAQDTLYIRSKSEDVKQAELKAEAGLWRANNKLQEGSITVEGMPYLVAGVNIELTGFVQLDGKYHAEETTHSWERGGGYSTSATIKRVSKAVTGKRNSQTVVAPGNQAAANTAIADTGGLSAMKDKNVFLPPKPPGI